jgi:hypothetical protein
MTFKLRVESSSILLFLLGVAALIVSIIYTFSVLAFIGLGLTFWGAILAYIRSGQYVKANVLNATTNSASSALNETLAELNYDGKPVYLPPKYFNDPDEVKIFISKRKDTKLPLPEQIQTLNTQSSSMNSQGMLLTPPGAELANLFERKLGTKFIKTDLEYAMKKLPKLIVEDLEMATDLQIASDISSIDESNKTADYQPTETPERIHVKITDSVYEEANKGGEQKPRIQGNIGCPLASAIAYVIAKSTGKPTIIAEENTSNEGRTVKIEYYTYQEE